MWQPATYTAAPRQLHSACDCYAAHGALLALTYLTARNICTATQRYRREEEEESNGQIE